MTASLYVVALHGDTLPDVSVKKTYRLTLGGSIPFGERAENHPRQPEKPDFQE